MILAAWLVWAIPIGAVPVVPVMGRISDRIRNWFAVGITGVTALIGFYLALNYSSPATETSIVWIPILNIPVQIEVDGLSTLLSAFIAFLSFLIALYSLGYMKEEKGQSRYYSLVLLFIGSMLALVLAGNFVQLYFFWEIVGICSAFLIAFYNEKPEARRAGIKAFVVTRFGDIALFIAVILTLSLLHTTDFASILSAISGKTLGNNTVQLIGVLILLGAMGKSAQVPLHVWLPDAMEGPTTVSALIHAATMVNAGVYVVLRFFPLFDSSQTLLTLVALVGAVSMVYGGACAFVSEDLKRILAYSTISQLGIMFLGIGVGTSLGSTYHLISQGLFKALAFLAAGSVLHATGLRNVEEMGGLKATMKYTYVAFLVSILTMSGLPPLVGFWSKDWIASTAFTTNAIAFFLIVLSSVLTTSYGFRALYKVFHGSPNLPKLPKESPTVMVVPMMILSVSLVFGWLILNYQSVLPLIGSEAVNPLTIGISVAALAIGFAIAYLAFLTRSKELQSVIQRSNTILSLRKFLLEGLGFDRFYNFLYSKVFLPLARISSRLQSGVLGVNSVLMLLTILMMLFLLLIGAL